MSDDRYCATGVESGTRERVSATGATAEEARSKLNRRLYSVYPNTVVVYDTKPQEGKAQ